MNFKVGDEVMFIKPDSFDNGDVGVVTKLDVESDRVWAMWERTKTEQFCRPESLRLITKLDKALM